MLKFCEQLYVSDSIKPKVNSIKLKAYSGIGMTGITYIMFSSNNKDIFDIYPASYFKQKKLRKRDFLVIGIAKNKAEAMEMVTSMIMEGLSYSDSFDKFDQGSGIRKYFERKILGVEY